MNDLLHQELVPPVTVRLGGKEYRLAFPMGVVLLYKQRTGDNLCQVGTWQKIAPGEDPERFLACIWAGLHSYDAAGKKFVEQLSYDELGSLVDFGNAGEITLALSKALTSHFPAAKDEPDPNVQAPEATPATPNKKKSHRSE